MNVFFLGYDRSQTRLIAFLESLGHTVEHSSAPVTQLQSWDVVLSFGYRHILSPKALATAKRPVINLHIAFLPYNRGAHPFFWAAYDATPCGVTIHEIDAGIDTGPIILRELCKFDYERETFKTAYTKLIDRVESLFERAADFILSQRYTASRDEEEGTFHRARDLPQGFSWDDAVAPTIKRLKHSASLDRPCSAGNSA